MSFPLPSGPYQGLFSPEPLNELPGLPLAPLPNVARMPTAIPAPSAPMSSMPGRPGSPNRPDWATILSLVLPAVIAAMKGGGAAPLGAFYQSFAQAKDVGQMREMEQEETTWRRQEIARKEHEAQAERNEQRRVSRLQLQGQLDREVRAAKSPSEFRRRRAMAERTLIQAGLDTAEITAMEYSYEADLKAAAVKWAEAFERAYTRNPKAAEAKFGPVLEPDPERGERLIDSGLTNERGERLRFTPSEAFRLAGIATTDQNRPIVKPEKETTETGSAESRYTAMLAQADALEAEGRKADADGLRLAAKRLLERTVTFKRATERPPGQSVFAAPFDRTRPDLRGNPLFAALPLADQDLITAVLEYRAPVPPSGTAARDPYWKRLFDLAIRIDPTFNVQEYPARQKLLNDFTSGKTADNIVAINTAVDHLDTLKGFAEGLRNRDLRATNAFVNWVKDQTGDPSVTGFDTASTALANEMATIFKRTGATDQEIAQWRIPFNRSLASRQFDAVFDTSIKLMRGRLNATRGRWAALFKDKPFPILTDRSRGILEDLGYNPGELEGSAVPTGPSRRDRINKLMMAPVKR